MQKIRDRIKAFWLTNQTTPAASIIKSLTQLSEDGQITSISGLLKKALRALTDGCSTGHGGTPKGYIQRKVLDGGSKNIGGVLIWTEMIIGYLASKKQGPTYINSNGQKLRGM